MSSVVSYRRRPAACAAVLLCAFGVQTAHGQAMTVVRRSGINLAYCGPYSGPLVVEHNFLTPADVHDEISVSDPGPPLNRGNASLDSVMSPNSIAISLGGGSFRGFPVGLFYAAADTRDFWTVRVESPTCFTFSVSMRADSTSSPDQLQTYNFSGPGLTAAPGTPPATFSDSFRAPGLLERSGTGTLAPGEYSLGISGRADAGTFPYEASYSHSIALTLGPPALAGAPMSASSCAGGSASFTITPLGAGPFTYQWRVESPEGSGVYVDLAPGTFFEPSSGLTFDAAGAMGPLLVVSDLQLAAHAGVIRFTARIANACGASTSAPAAWTICGGDLNCDDIVDFADYLEFLNLFDAQDVRVDYNHDGVVDFSDYLEFLNHFDVGC